MNDIDLLVFGCAVLFIAAAGGYVFARERFVYSDEETAEGEVSPIEPVSLGKAPPVQKDGSA